MKVFPKCIYTYIGRPFVLQDNHKTLLYLINIHKLTVNFDGSSAGHVEGDILSGHPAMIPSAVIQCIVTL